MGRRLAAVLGAPFVELDSIFHQPGWAELPAGEFRRRVADLTAGETWVVDGNYAAVRDLSPGAPVHAATPDGTPFGTLVGPAS